MARAQGNTKLIITSIALGLTILVVAIVLTVQRQQTDTTESASTPEADSSVVTKDTAESTDEIKPETPAVDPATLASIAVEPLGVTISYTKGIQAFGYEVKRTADSTIYAEFSADDLIGTKCTDDTGLFASIIKNPTSTEDQTILANTVKLGGDTYGLSLAGEGCTSDGKLLREYQSAFSNGFSSLRSL